MENRPHALIAGIFVICMSAAIAYVATWLSGNDIQRTHYLVFTKESVSGLNPQSSVHYRGVNIGKVENIEFDPDDPQLILIQIAVDENVKLRNSIYAQLGYQGVTGLAHIQLNDEGLGTEELSSDARIPMRRSLLDEVAVSGQDLLNNINQLVAKMHQLLNDQNQTHIAQILSNIEQVTKNFDGITEHLPPVLNSFSNLTHESGTLIRHLDQILAEINLVLAKVNQSDGILDSLSQSSQELTTVIPELHKISHHISRNSASLDRVLNQLEENPQSLLLGRPSATPGPGEAGFVPPRKIQP